MTSKLLLVLSHFEIPPAVKLKPLGQGNINKTYFVDCGYENYVLQEINTELFPQPEKAIFNINQTLKAQKAFFQERGKEFELLDLIPLAATKEFLFWKEKKAYRVFRYLENALIFQNLGELALKDRKKVAFELGKGWAVFHQSVLKVNPDTLAIVLEHFHDTSNIYHTFLTVLQKSEAGAAKINWKKEPRVEHCVRFIQERAEFTLGQKDLVLPDRVTHNDTKLNNCVFESKDLTVRCLIDLDTIQKGKIHFDVGDGIRCAANLAGEETQNLADVFWDLESCAQIFDGYLEQATFLTENEKKILPLSPKILALELGIRFLSDYLEGDLYFQNFDLNRPLRNLERAEVQLKLVAEFEKQESFFFGCV